MNSKNILSAQVLSYLGVLPFLVLTIAIGAQVGGFDYQLALFAYGAVILSFLCGIHWAIFLFFSKQCPHNLLLRSNLVSLMGWGSLLLIQTQLTAGIQMFGFVYLLRLDWQLQRHDILPLWFFNVRCLATSLVVLLLAMTIIFGK